jgi:hypothetical protein
MSNITSSVNAIVDPSNYIKYIIMQTFYIPSILCSIFTLSHLLANRRLRLVLHNHTSLVLLIISIFDSFLNHPFTLNYLRTGRVTPSTSAMCFSWNLFNSVLTTSNYLTMAWASVERHFLIFYSILFTTSRGRVLFHYIPLVLVALIYPIVAYAVVIFLYPCISEFNMAVLFCGYTCALKIPSVALFMRIGHIFVPVFIVTGSTIILIARVIKQKHRMQNNQVQRPRHCRMIIQLCTLASLFIALALPSAIVGVVQSCCLPTFAVALQVPYFTFLVRFNTMLMPFMCLSSLPEIRSKLLMYIKHPSSLCGSCTK